jgi:hypothetical protein
VFRVTKTLKLELQQGEFVDGREVRTCFKLSSAKKDLIVLAQSMDEMQSWMEAIINVGRSTNHTIDSPHFLFLMSYLFVLG